MRKIAFRFLIFLNIAVVMTGVVLRIRNQPSSRFLREISTSEGFESAVALVQGNGSIFTFYFFVCFVVLFFNAVFLWAFVKARLVAFLNITFVIFGVLFHVPDSVPSTQEFQRILKNKDVEEFISSEYSIRYFNSIYLFAYFSLLTGSTVLLSKASRLAGENYGRGSDVADVEQENK